MLGVQSFVAISVALLAFGLICIFVSNGNGVVFNIVMYDSYRILGKQILIPKITPDVQNMHAQ